MPANGWRFVRLTGLRMKTLSYVKGDEVCQIIIERHDRGEGRHTQRENREEWWAGGEGEAATHLHVR